MPEFLEANSQRRGEEAQHGSEGGQTSERARVEKERGGGGAEGQDQEGGQMRERASSGRRRERADVL